ncbi:hypothetical protein ABE85_13990 [Mitsuaria sp. 7]|nr:hypothetical protein ABE85_13990 [Mitsuaria sp. 7]
MALSATAVSPVVCAAEMSRAEIGAARARIEQTYQAKVRECNQRFVVTGCLEDARDERIRQLRPLDHAEHQVNAEERLRRSAAARERVEQNEREAAKDEARRKTESVREAAQAASVPMLPGARTPRANPELHQRREAQLDAEAKADAAKRREAAAERRQKAQDRQRKAEAQQGRSAEKAASAASAPVGKNTKPPAAHLPTPSASDIRALPKP